MLVWSIKIQWSPFDCRPKKCAALQLVLNKIILSWITLVFFLKKSWKYLDMTVLLHCIGAWVHCVLLKIHCITTAISFERDLDTCDSLMKARGSTTESWLIVFLIIHWSFLHNYKIHWVSSYWIGYIVRLLLRLQFRIGFVAHSCFKGTVSRNRANT